jgi:cell division protein FtsQ
MPLEFDDPDGDGMLRPTTDRFGSSSDRFGSTKRPWWQPASTVGRVFLASGALLVFVAFTTACLMVRHSLERDARFRIAGTDDIQAAGLTEVSRSEMMPVFGEDIGRNIFFVPIDQRRRQLEEIPWVERATVMRVLPNQIRVDVVERQPVAFTRHGEQIGLVDANGVLLAMAPATMAKHHYSFPVLTGIDAGDPADSRKERMDVYLRMMAELDAGGKHNSEQISEIDLTDPEDARVLMPEQGADILAHLGEDHFLERYERYQEHIAEWRQQYPHLAGVDLRYDNQVVLDMASGKETAETSSGDAVPAATATPETNPPAAMKSSDAKSAGAKPLAAKTSGTKTPGPKTTSATAAKKSKSERDKLAQDKKHATQHTVPAKRAATQSTTKRNSASTNRPATATKGSNSRALPATVTQGG